MSWLRCSSSGQWVPAFGSSHMTEPFCIPKSCPDQIPNGALSSSCSAKVGCTCNYSCDTGYTKTDVNIVCETSANWSTNPHSLCKRTNFQQCPYEVRNGDLDKDCSRHPGDICTFICREGYTGSQQQTVYCAPLVADLF